MPYQLTVQRNLTSYNAKDYGATGNGTTDDTTALQAPLTAAKNAGGGNVFVPAGTYLISAPLIISSYTSLILSRNATITLAANANCNMLQNTAVTPQRSVSDAAITNASTTLTSNTANFTSTDVGRTVVITGAWQSSNNLCTTIASVTNSTTVVLNTAATATVSGAACSIFTRDTNIEIAGGTWNRGNNGNATSATVATNTTNLRHTDNLYVHDTTFVYGTLKSYNLALVDVTNVSIKNITLNGPNTVLNTDGVCIDGPAQWINVDGVYGTTGDDFCSFHTISIDSAAGNQSDITVTNLFPNQVGQAAYKSHADSGTTVRSLTVRGVHGTVVSGGVHIQDYVTPNSDSNMSNVLIDDIDCTIAGNSIPLVYIYCNNSTGTITCRNIVWRGTGSPTQAIYFASGSTLGTLIVDGIQIEAGTGINAVYVNGTLNNLIVQNVSCPNTSVLTNAVVSCDTSASIKSIAISNVIAYFTTTAQNPVLSNKGSLKVVSFNNIYLNNGGIVLLHKNSPSSIQALMNNVTLDSAYQLAQLIACAADISISNLNVISSNQSVLIACTTAGSNLTVRGKGFINPGNKTCFSRDGTQTVRINHPEMLADLSTLTPTDQDMVSNNNGSLSCGTGICLYHTGGTGNGWKNLYSGATY
jgi:hypothetical protein